MRRLRATRGLSQEALAHECGINRTYLSGVERSERNVSIDNIRAHREGTARRAVEATQGRLSRSRQAVKILCRFSDAGIARLSMRSGDRRLKSAKARNRGG
jgi:transcriptional regulator with XRE-family HTH domain